MLAGGGAGMGTRTGAGCVDNRTMVSSLYGQHDRGKEPEDVDKES